MANARDIKGRLKSIKNTKKTTHAMELVSGAKMRKAVEAASKTRAYRAASWSIMQRLRGGVQLPDTDPLSRFFAAPSGTRTVVIALTSNRGLCGAFNSNIVKMVAQYAAENDDQQVEIIGIGKRGVGSFTSLGLQVVQAYEKDDQAKDDSSVREIVASVHSRFADGEVGSVLIAYTDFKSAVDQTPRLEQLFPFPEESALGAEEEGQEDGASYAHEPSEEEVLSTVIPRAAEVLLYQALLESNASEHSSRMIAMKNATEAAGEMAEDLTLQFNRARQAAITNEIAEIAAGTAAVR